MEGWACYGLDVKARGPIGNALYRQLKKNPEMTEAYRWLFDDLKKKFRQNWAFNRNFEFVQRKRIKSIATKTKQEEIGVWKNELQLAVHFGGANEPEAKRQAANYITRCRDFQDNRRLKFLSKLIDISIVRASWCRTPFASSTSGRRLRTFSWWRS